MIGKGIVFDFDGTLADTLPDVTDAVNVGLESFGLQARSIEEVSGYIGDGILELCRRAVGEDSPISLEELAAVISNHYQDHRLDKVSLFAGIPELLDELTRRGIPLAVLSNKPHQHTWPMVEALFGKWPFVAVEGYREEGLRKPDPRTVLGIVKQMGLSAGQVLMVGDSSTDMITAVNAGLIPVGATWGYRSREELIKTGAKYLIDSPEMLLERLTKPPFSSPLDKGGLQGG
ncbi:MAG: HAD family hydrolase [Planctomycetota bacterium]